MSATEGRGRAEYREHSLGVDVEVRRCEGERASLERSDRKSMLRNAHPAGGEGRPSAKAGEPAKQEEP